MSAGGEIAEVKSDEGAGALTYPLPSGVLDADMNRSELSEAMNVSVNTIDSWRTAGMPFEERGSNGRSYTYRLSVCYDWRMRREKSEESQRARVQESAAQMRMSFLNADDDSKSSRLSPKDQKELAAASLVWMQAARQRRELIPVDEVSTLLEDIFSAVRDSLGSLPDRLAREVNLTAEETDKATIACDDALREMKQKIAAAQMEPQSLGEMVA